MDEQKYNLEQSIAELGKLLDLSAKETDQDTCEALAEKAKIIYEQFPESEDIALRYVKTLSNSADKQTEIREVNRTVEKVKIIYEKFHNSERIASWYAWLLQNLVAKQTEIGEVNRTVEKVKIIYEKFHNSEEIASWYAGALSKLTDKQTEIEEVNRTVEKVKIIYEKFHNSEKIASWYAWLLQNLVAKQTEIGEVNRTVEKVKIIYEKFHNSEEIASWYAGALSNSADKQTEIEELRHTVKQICDILKSIPDVKSFATLVKILENNPDTPLYINDTPATSLTKILDRLCFYSNDGFDRKLLIRALNLDLVINTKYDILKDWIKYYKDDENKLNQLIDIYRIVQKIKYHLGLKDEDKNQVLKFGHYTKGSTLQIMLDQEENEKKKSTFSVSGKTRLYNANYMNDPEEGIVIEQILGLDRRDILEPSSWFLMSFTNKTDDLAMWSQYGDDAKGVCLVLREDDFSRFTSFNDVSWRKEAIPLVETMSKVDSTLSYDLKGSPNELNNIKPTVAIKDEEKRSKSEKKENVPKRNNDYLYRIAYVKNIGEDIELEQTELFEKSEIEELEKLLNSLKEKLDSGSKVTEENYQDAIAECIEEIRYLFKSVDYKYENELRILRYANLDPSNDKIKIDKESGIGKLYVERENPIQIDEVIFGPKFPNPEYVTPLLKLLDKKIKYKKSTIKFR